MAYKAENKYFDKIVKKVEDGIFTKGINYDNHICLTDEEVKQTPVENASREFYIRAYSSYYDNKRVLSYIKTHLDKFDRQFFKDLIESNTYATQFDTNCFAIMPLEYIDEEMCSLAYLKNKDWSDSDWFFSVIRRKPEVLTEDLWKLGVRLYATEDNGKEFLRLTPEEYKDDSYYIEMCSCCYNCNCALDGSKGKIMDVIPQEILTTEFLIDLLANDINSIAIFNEKALETKVPFDLDGQVVFEPIWKFVVMIKGDVIRNIKLNDERVDFFLKHYDKDSYEYVWCFKDNYKRYLKKKKDSKSLEVSEKRTQEYAENNAKLTLKEIFEGRKTPEEAIDDVNNLPSISKGSYKINYLPIKYKGAIPKDLVKIYDSEEYLEMMYKELGIQIIGENDKFLFEVEVPEGWTVKVDGYFNYVYDESGTLVLEYFDGGNFWDRDVYVREIHLQEEKQDKLSLN